MISRAAHCLLLEGCKAFDRWTFAILKGIRQQPMKYPFAIYTPCPQQVWDYMKATSPTEFGSDMQTYPVHPVTDGKIYEDETIAVEALHTLHLGEPSDGVWRSFSYRITGKDSGKRTAGIFSRSGILHKLFFFISGGRALAQIARIRFYCGRKVLKIRQEDDAEEGHKRYFPSSAPKSTVLPCGTGTVS